jgi:hypothetical protein
MFNSQVFSIVKQYLANFAAKDDFENVIASVFGSAASGAVGAVRQQWLGGDFSLIPEVRIVSNGELGTANGAYAASLDEILVSADFLVRHEGNVAAVAELLLEEIGHKLDRLLNGAVDSPGDEGAIFRLLATRQKLSVEILGKLRATEDRTVINVIGQSVEIEAQNFTGTPKFDYILGTSGNDYIDALAGNDYVDSGAGDDTVYGGTGNDRIFAGTGNDTIYGGTGNDDIKGEAGNDIIYGDEIYSIDSASGNAFGNDTIFGGGGADTLKGGAGDDTYEITLDAGGSRIEDLAGTDTLNIAGIVEKRLNKGEMGFDRFGTSLIIDLDKDGQINSTKDLTIVNFFSTPDGLQRGSGFIESISGLSGDKVLKLFEPTDDDVPAVSVSDAYVSVNQNQDTVIKFKVALSKPSDESVLIIYSTSDKSANSIGKGAAKDYQLITNETLTFSPGETTKEIEVTVFGERGVSDQDLEIFAKDTAYRNWVKEQDVDQIPNLNSSPYGDLGYSVDQVFSDPKSDFQAVGLTSNETFSLILTSANNATIADSTAIGTIYDLGKAPILASRGTATEQDIFSDANPNGVGFDQYRDNQSAVETWLKKVSQPENGGVIFRPNLTGHSLGGALTQLIAYKYTGNLGKVVTFNSPGVNSSGAPKAGITSTTHYITSSDIVSMAGSNYLPGSYVLSDYSSGGLFGVADTHLLPMLSSQVGYDSINLATWKTKPTPLSKSSELSSSSLSNFFFTYLPDPDYFAFQVAVALGSPEFAQDLTFRGTTEQSRVALGKFVYDLLDRLDNFPERVSEKSRISPLAPNSGGTGIESLPDSGDLGGVRVVDRTFQTPSDQVISSISKAALNAAKNYSSSVWNTIIQSTRDSLNQLSTNTLQFQASSLPVNAVAFSTSDVVSPWASFSKWTVGIWEASPEWNTQTFSNAIANINTPPGVENPILDQVAIENKPFSLTFAETTFVEIDSNDSLIYSSTLADDSSLPTWLSFNPTTQSFLGTPTKENIGSINIKVTATDKTGATVSDVFTLAVNITDNDAEIRGLQWNDVNGNGVKDTTETGLKDWKIYLDTNTNGQLDAGELSTTTDADGNYSFTNLRPGTYTVAEEIQPGWKQTYPGVSITTTASDIQLINPSSPIITSDTFSTTSATSLVNLDQFWADSRFTNIKGKGFSTVIIDTGADLNSPYFGADANNDGIADKIVYQYDCADNDTDASDKNPRIQPDHPESLQRQRYRLLLRSRKSPPMG